MNKLLNYLLVLAITASFAACGGTKEKGKLGDKKAELEKLKLEQKKINDQISKVEDELAKLDSTSVKAKLVAVEPIGTDAFNHYIDLQAAVDAKNSAYIAPKGQGGVVRALYVKQGDHVSKGQAVLKLDDAIYQQQVSAAQHQTGSIKAQLNLAQTTYQRYKNLWENNIGTQQQVDQAKTQVEALTSQLRAAEAQVQQAREMLSYTNVRSDISGVVDQVNVRVGEMFAGATATGGQITIVNTSNLKVVAKVPESYIDRVKQGTPVIVTLPDANNMKINGTASVVSKSVDPVSRTFSLEIAIPQNALIKANQIANVQIMDYSRPNAITIPVNTLQSDEKGKYVLVAVTENGKLIARKKTILVGELYGDRLEVKSGLNAGDTIITEGFQSLYDGQLITTGK